MSTTTAERTTESTAPSVASSKAFPLIIMGLCIGFLLSASIYYSHKYREARAELANWELAGENVVKLGDNPFDPVTPGNVNNTALDAKRKLDHWEEAARRITYSNTYSDQGQALYTTISKPHELAYFANWYMERNPLPQP